MPSKKLPTKRRREPEIVDEYEEEDDEDDESEDDMAVNAQPVVEVPEATAFETSNLQTTIVARFDQNCTPGYQLRFLGFFISQLCDFSSNILLFVTTAICHPCIVIANAVN